MKDFFIKYPKTFSNTYRFAPFLILIFLLFVLSSLSVFLYHWSLGVGIGFLILGLILVGIRNIKGNHVGIVKIFNDKRLGYKCFNGTYLSEGFWYLIPIIFNAEEYNISNQTQKIEEVFVTDDLQFVRLKYQIKFNVFDPYIFSFQEQKDDKFGINNIITSIIRNYITENKFDYKDFIHPKSEFQEIILNKSNEELNPLGININQLSITHISADNSLHERITKNVSNIIDAKNQIEIEALKINTYKSIILEFVEESGLGVDEVLKMLLIYKDKVNYNISDRNIKVDLSNALEEIINNLRR